MSQATLNLSVVSKRILTKGEAASYCGMSVKHFKIECPVRPIQYKNGDIRYDVHDLDEWLNGLKTIHLQPDIDLMIERLD